MLNDMVHQLAAMPKRERRALKRRVLALFRRAELVCLKGKLDDKKTESLHKSGLNNARQKKLFKHYNFMDKSGPKLLIPIYLIGHHVIHFF